MHPQQTATQSLENVKANYRAALAQRGELTMSLVKIDEQIVALRSALEGAELGNKAAIEAAKERVEAAKKKAAEAAKEVAATVPQE